MNLFLFSGLKIVDSRHGQITDLEHFYNILISYQNELDCMDTEIIVAVVLIILAIFYVVDRMIHLATCFFKWYYTDTEIYDVERKSSARIGHMEFNFQIIALRK